MSNPEETEKERYSRLKEILITKATKERKKEIDGPLCWWHKIVAKNFSSEGKAVVDFSSYTLQVGERSHWVRPPTQKRQKEGDISY